MQGRAPQEVGTARAKAGWWVCLESLPGWAGVQSWAVGAHPVWERTQPQLWGSCSHLRVGTQLLGAGPRGVSLGPVCVAHPAPVCIRSSGPEALPDAFSRGPRGLSHPSVNIGKGGRASCS